MAAEAGQQGVTMTPEFKLDELKKMLWSKLEWLEHPTKRKNYPNSIETKSRERDVLAAVIADYEKLIEKRAQVQSGKEK